MKRILIYAVLLFAMAAVRAQDAATEERVNKLNGHVEDLLAAQADMQKRIASLARELEAVREQNKSGSVVATQDDIKRLSDALQEVDRKRLEDYEKIHKQIKDLGKVLASPSATGGTSSRSREKEREPKTSAVSNTIPDEGFEYIVQKDDNLSIIIQAYQEKGIKVTQDDIVKANPGLKPNRLLIGQKVFIPAPKK